jgi:hypothetical protein
MTKNKKNNIIDFFKENKWTFIIAAGIIIFYEPLKILIDKLLINPIFSKIEATQTLNVLFFIFLGITLAYWIHKIFWRNYKVALKHILIYGVILTGYLIYRFNQELGWSLLNMKNSWEIYYADILIVICVMAILTRIIGILTNTLLFKYTKKKISSINLKPKFNWIVYNFTQLNKKLLKEPINKLKNNLETSIPNNDNDNDNDNGFEIDEPLSSINDIENKEWDTSKEIVNNILNTKLGNGSFVIGLNGEWGSGKSTYWNLMKEKLNVHTDYILIEFNPWNNECDTSITQNFLNKFKSEVSKYHSNITPEIEKYSKAISQTYKNGIIKTLTGFTSKSHNSVEEELERLKKTILQIKKRIIIFIDDIDRLCNDEIYEVLKLVRNNANFPNTFFILAYDREYIEKSLSNLDIPKPNQYIEKIINHEHILPNLKQQLLIKTLEDLIAKELNLNSKSDTQFTSEFTKINNYSTSFFSLISNYRDIKKLANLISEKFVELKTETQLSDLILIEALHLKHPMIFKPLQENKINFLNWSKLEGRYVKVNKNLEQSFPTREEEKSTYTSETEDTFTKIFKSTTLSKQDQDKIISFFYEFAASKRIEDLEEHNKYLTLKSFINKYSFDTYLDSPKNSKSFTFQKFENWKNDKGFNTDNLNKLYKTKNEFINLINILSSITLFYSTEEFINVNKALIYLSKISSYIDEDLISNIIKEVKQNCNTTPFVSTFNYENFNLQEIFKEILKPINPPYLTEKALCTSLNSTQTSINPESKTLSDKTLNELLQMYNTETKSAARSRHILCSLL